MPHRHTIDPAEETFARITDPDAIERQARQQEALVAERRRNSVQELLDYLEAVNSFDSMLFFQTFVWPRQTPLHEHQRLMLDEMRVFAHQIHDGEGTTSLLIDAPTGCGKSVIVDYFSVLAAGTFIEHQGRKSPRQTLIVACPTVQLCHEVQNRLVEYWRFYLYAVRDRPDISLIDKAPPRQVRITPDNRVWTDAPIKLMAGSTADESLFYGTAGADGERGASRRLAWVVVATYEHACSLIASSHHKLWKFENSPPDTVLSHISGVVFDEAHNIMGGRPAARALWAWLNHLRTRTVYMTGTFITGLDRLGCKVYRRYTCERAYPRVLLPFPIFPEIGGMVRTLADAVIRGWLCAIRTGERCRTAIFVEDKLVLKAVLSLAVGILGDPTFERDHPRMGLNVAPYADKDTRDLDDQVRRDPLVAFDTVAYGEPIDGTRKMPFRSVIHWAFARGLFIVTGDMSAFVRRRLAGILANETGRWRVVLASSALAEGCNLRGLRYVVIGAQAASGKKTFVSVTKVAQEYGRCDREDIGGIIYTPSEERLSDAVMNADPIELGISVIGRGIATQTARNVLHGVSANPFAAMFSAILQPERFDATFNGQPKRDDLQRRAWTCSCVLTGWQSLPYPVGTDVTHLPVFISAAYKRELTYVRPCLLASIIKLTQPPKRIWIGPFMLRGDDLMQFSWLPSLPALALILIWLTLPGCPGFGALAAKRNAAYKALWEQTEHVLLDDPALRALYKVMRTVSIAIGKAAESKCTGGGSHGKVPWYSAPMLAFDKEADAIAAFVVLLFHQSRDWDRTCSQWAVYRPAYGGVLQRLDILIGILLANPLLPLLQAQLDLLNQVAAGDAETGWAADLSDVLTDDEARISLFAPMPPWFVFGVRRENVATRGPALATTDWHPTVRGDVSCENHVLLLLLRHARHLSRAWRMDYKKGLTLRHYFLAKNRGAFDDLAMDLVQVVCPEDRNEARLVPRYLLMDRYQRIPLTRHTSLDEEYGLP